MLVSVLELVALYGIIPSLLVVLIIISYKNRVDIVALKADYALNHNTETEQLQKIGVNTTEIYGNTSKLISKETEDENHKINIIVNQQLQRLLLHTNSNHVYCALYNNKNDTVTGRHIQNLSIVYEQIDDHTVPIMTDYHNVSRMIFPIVSQKIKEQGYYYINNMQDIEKVDSMSYYFFKSRGVQAVFIQGLIDTRKNILGFVAIEYSDKESVQFEDLKDVLVNKTKKLADILENTNLSNLD